LGAAPTTATTLIIAVHPANNHATIIIWLSTAVSDPSLSATMVFITGKIM